MMTQNGNTGKVLFGLICLTVCFFFVGCHSKSSETQENSTDSVTQIAPQDTIVSFEALFKPGQYGKFLDQYWTSGCNEKLYPISKALSRMLDCPCSAILPTIEKDQLIISLNNSNCFPPEVEEANFHPNHQIALPLETLRSFLNEKGLRIVFESGAYLQNWLAEQKQIATAEKKSPYTLYISLIVKGEARRVVLQSTEGNNNQIGTITGYFETSDGKIIDVTGYRTWGGFVVYDPKKDGNEGLEFFWSDEAQGETTHPVRNRHLGASYQSANVYIEYVKLVEEFSAYEGPEDAYREPENGTPDTGN